MLTDNDVINIVAQSNANTAQLAIHRLAIKGKKGKLTNAHRDVTLFTRLNKLLDKILISLHKYRSFKLVPNIISI